MSEETCSDGRPVEEVVEEIRRKFREEILVARRGRTLVIQAPTWLVNESFDLQDVADEYVEDPLVFGMEYGAEFAEAVNAWIPELVVDACRGPFSPPPPRTSPRVLALDPGLKHNRYGLAMGYKRKDCVYIEMARTWEGSQNRPVDIEEVESFVLDELKPKYRIVLAVLDQYQSASTIQRFNKAGLKTEETFFTAPRNVTIYAELRKLMVAGKFRFDDDDLEEELKHLQQIVTANSFKVQPAPGYFGDLADCVANCAYELGRLKTGKVVF